MTAKQLILQNSCLDWCSITLSAENEKAMIQDKENLPPVWEAGAYFSIVSGTAIRAAGAR